MSPFTMLAAEASSSGNQPLAIVTIVVSLAAIAAMVVISLRQRNRYDPADDETLLDALDTVSWYALEVGPELTAADPGDRDSIVDETQSRVADAQSVLKQVTDRDEGLVWHELAKQLTATKLSYQQFAKASPGDETARTAVDLDQGRLTRALDDVRDYLA